MVESMSATNSMRQRGSSSWTTKSTPSRELSAQRADLKSPVKRRSAASPSSIQCAKLAWGSTSRSRPSARSTRLSSNCPAAISVAMAIPVSKPPLALIAGPTASGKSALALELAQRTGGAIVNADSAQLYRDLPVLSAAPTAADLAGATGLYLRTLLDGIAPVPRIDPDVRQRVREAAVEENRAKLEALDPEAA